MIGPEGDFDKKEINLAANNGFTPISFGEAILRTETAGIFIASMVKSFQKWFVFFLCVLACYYHLTILYVKIHINWLNWNIVEVVTGTQILHH